MESPGEMAKKCPLCHMFREHCVGPLVKYPGAQHYKLQAHTLLSYANSSFVLVNSDIRAKNLDNTPRGIAQPGYLAVTPEWASQFDLATRATTKPILYHQDGSEERAFVARAHILEPGVDYLVISSWLDYCTSNHGRACQVSGAQVEGLKLINCRKLVVERAGQFSVYAALSYVWGGVDAPKICTPSNDAVPVPTNLPKTIQDAITVCNKLSVPYLWVDSLCIDQENPKEVTDQVNQMSSIYKQARFTIVAAAGENSNSGLPGTNNTKRSPQLVVRIGNINFISTMRPPTYAISNSVWSSRGWTLQEAVLSHRRVVFTEDQVYFECRRMSCQESLQFDLDFTHSDDKSRSKNFMHPYILNPRAPSFTDNWLENRLQGHSNLSALKEYIQEYSRRDLNFDADSLRAFSGILNEFGASENPVRHVWGIPFLSPFVLQQELGLSLLWYHIDKNSSSGTVQQRLGFPTWSWAGWKGEIKFWRYDSSILMTNKQLFKGTDFWLEYDAGRRVAANSLFDEVSLEPQDLYYPEALIFSCSVVYPDTFVRSASDSSLRWLINGRVKCKLFLSRKQGMVDRLENMFKARKMYLLVIADEYDGFSWEPIIIVEETKGSSRRVGFLKCDRYHEWKELVNGERREVRLV